MIDKIENNQLLNGASAIYPKAKRALPDNDLDVSINTDYPTLIEMALKSSQTDAEIIEIARESIRTGELESYANIRKAAENIITFGI